VKILIVHCSPSSYYFLHLMSKYSPQHFALRS